MTHTPGPWKIGNHPSEVVAENEVVTTNHRHVFDKTDTEYYGGYLIAESILRKENALLIAAAPELLKSLKDLIMWYDDGVRTHEPDCPTELAAIWKSAREAVDKAKGWENHEKR